MLTILENASRAQRGKVFVRNLCVEGWSFAMDRNAYYCLSRLGGNQGGESLRMHKKCSEISPTPRYP